MGKRFVSESIIGIDLGTTNSEVAVIQAGQVEVIEIEGSRLLPSVVGLAEDGSLLVGQAARNQAALHPERTVRSIKRRMGEDIRVPLGGTEYSPQEISALILGRLKRAAEDYLHGPVGRAVITVPAYFSDAQRQATRDAGELAGLEVRRIINEPTVAALAYEAEHPQRKHVLVYDLGGGTFDVSVVRVEGDVVEVLASHGNNHLGGDDFDARIIEHLQHRLKEEHAVDAGSDPRVMARLARAAEAAKIRLSDAPYARVEEEYLLEHDGSPIHLDVELERHDYEAMIEPYLAETLEAVHTALEGAKLTASEIDEVLLVGGATRTPVIQRRLEEELGLQPRSELDPDLCVATGAALQAAMIAGERVASVLLDITPYTFGTSALGELNGEPYPYAFIPMIRKNTPIPVTKSEAFYTVHDGQEMIEVRVYQGEDPDALNNAQIGSFHVEGLRGMPAGEPIIMTFSLDLNGILQVSAMEKRTGLEKRITIDNATARFERDEMSGARERIHALIEGEARPAEQHNRQSVQTEALLEKAERLMESATPEDREDLVNAIEAVRDALAAEDSAELQRATDELTDLIFYLEA